MKARLVSIQLQLEIVADDGTTLHPVTTNPAIVPAARVEAIPQAIREAVAQVQQQLDAQTNTPPTD